MPTFKYRAKDGPQDIDGTVEALTRAEAIEKINQSGYLPVRVEEETLKEKSKIPDVFVGKVRSKDVTIFSRQLAILIKSGVPILRGLTIIADQSRNPQFKKVLNNIQAAVKDGKSLSSALTNYPKIFSPLYIAMVRSGETSGTLQELLIRIADYRQKQEVFLSRVRSALAYPVLMAMVGAGTIIFMLVFVMPRLMRIFSRMGQELPIPTKILLTISSALQHGWIGILIVLAVMVVLIRRGAKTKAQKMAFSRFKLGLPIIGDFIVKSELAHFSATLELLIRSSISILKAIDVATPILNNEVIKEELRKSYKHLEEGGSFGKSLLNAKLFPGFMTSLIIVGEESGRLDEALGEIARSYENDTDEAIKVMTSLIEPIMILLMGLIVGFIVIAMLLPVFQINMMAG
jgi:type II secretory pathway component PulF